MVDRSRLLVAALLACVLSVPPTAAPAVADPPDASPSLAGCCPGQRPTDQPAAVVRTRYGVIASTQGSPPDTADTFIRLYDRQRARYGTRIGIRLFSTGDLPLPGDGTRSGKLLTWAASQHPDELITVSHKNRDEERLRRFLDWVQQHRLRASIIYFHEPQNDWFDPNGPHDRRAEPSTYRAAYHAYRAVITGHAAAGRVTLEKNLAWHWQHYRAARIGGDWRKYVQAGDPADLVSWDPYVFPGMPTTQGRYATPDEFFRYARDIWRQHGLPWAVGEIGTAVQDGVGSERDWDPDGTLFAAWVARITAAAADPTTINPTYAGVPPATFVKWWAGPDANDTDLSLDQVPAAVTTYRRLVRAAPL